MAAGSAGSPPQATPGRPWVSRLTHRICAGSRGNGAPRKGPAPITDPVGAVLPGAVYDTVLAAIVAPLLVAIIERRRADDRMDW